MAMGEGAVAMAVAMEEGAVAMAVTRQEERQIGVSATLLEGLVSVLLSSILKSFAFMAFFGGRYIDFYSSDSDVLCMV